MTYIATYNDLITRFCQSSSLVNNFIPCVNKEEYTLTHREAVSTKLNLMAFNIELVSFALAWEDCTKKKKYDELTEVKVIEMLQSETNAIFSIYGIIFYLQITTAELSHYLNSKTAIYRTNHNQTTKHT